MQFTFVFESKEGQNLSYLLGFIPCPVWKKGENELLNLHPEEPHFRVGDIETLINEEGLSGIKRVIVIIHKAGHATSKDLENVINELKLLGISFELVNL